MSDLIDRNMVNQELTEYIEYLNECTGNINPASLLMGVQGIIRTIPNAEKTGKWVDIVEMDSGGYPFKVGVCCSACGFQTLSVDNYCPHCGAKMEVEG